MRSCAALSLLVVALAGCGGGGDGPDLAGPVPTTVETAPITTELTTTTSAVSVGTTDRPTAPPTSTQRRRIAEQAAFADASIHRWNAALNACVGPSGQADDAGASCTRTAWDQLFDQMYAVQYELLAVMDRMQRGTCRDGLTGALDGIHGFLSGATPLKVVWLDDQQRPPMLFDLEAIVDVARPAGARMRDTLASSCGR